MKRMSNELKDGKNPINLNFIGSITGTSLSSPIPFHRDAKTMMMASSQRPLEQPAGGSLMADLPYLISFFRGN